MSPSDAGIIDCIKLVLIRLGDDMHNCASSHSRVIQFGQLPPVTKIQFSLRNGTNYKEKLKSGMCKRLQKGSIRTRILYSSSCEEISRTAELPENREMAHRLHLSHPCHSHAAWRKSVSNTVNILT